MVDSEIRSKPALESAGDDTSSEQRKETRVLRRSSVLSRTRIVSLALNESVLAG